MVKKRCSKRCIIASKVCVPFSNSLWHTRVAFVVRIGWSRMDAFAAHIFFMDHAICVVCVNPWNTDHREYSYCLLSIYIYTPHLATCALLWAGKCTREYLQPAFATYSSSFWLYSKWIRISIYRFLFRFLFCRCFIHISSRKCDIICLSDAQE